jgi:hypothetical protein
LITTGERVARLGVELLRVVDADALPAGLEDHGTRDDRSGERAHTGFVDAGDQRQTLLPELVLVAEHLPQALPFGAVRAPSLLHELEDPLRALPRIGPQRGFDLRRHRSRAIDVPFLQVGQRRKRHLAEPTEQTISIQALYWRTELKSL